MYLQVYTCVYKHTVHINKPYKYIHVLAVHVHSTYLCRRAIEKFCVLHNTTILMLQRHDHKLIWR